MKKILEEDTVINLDRSLFVSTENVLLSANYSVSDEGVFMIPAT